MALNADGECRALIAVAQGVRQRDRTPHARNRRTGDGVPTDALGRRDDVTLSDFGTQGLF